MANPYANRKAWAELPELALRDNNRYKLEEIHEEFAKTLRTSLENVFLIRELCLTFKDKARLEETVHTGLEFRGHPITLAPLHTKTWVSISRVQYGVPWESVKTALLPYGTIDRARPETLNNISTGTFSVLMQIDRPIPSKLSVANRVCYIFYRGQERTCLQCGQSCHQKNACPRNNANSNALPRASTWGNQDHTVDPVMNTPIDNTNGAAGPSIALDQPELTEPPTSTIITTPPVINDSALGNVPSPLTEEMDQSIPIVQTESSAVIPMDTAKTITLNEATDRSSSLHDEMPESNIDSSVPKSSIDNAQSFLKVSRHRQHKDPAPPDSRFRERSPHNPPKVSRSLQQAVTSRFQNSFSPLADDEETDTSDNVTENTSSSEDYEGIVDSETGDLIIAQNSPPKTRIPNHPFIVSESSGPNV